MIPDYFIHIEPGCSPVSLAHTNQVLYYTEALKQEPIQQRILFFFFLGNTIFQLDKPAFFRYNITIEFMLAGINMFWARLILARAAR